MKRKVFSGAAVLAVFGITAAFTACDIGPTGGDRTYTVSFDRNGGTCLLC